MNKILIWGTGNYAKQFIENGYAGEIIGFIETHKTKYEFLEMPVYRSDEIPSQFDYIVVANSYTAEIYDTCRQLHLDMEKVIFLYSIQHRVGCTDLSTIKKILSEQNYINYCARFGLFQDTFVGEDAKKYEQLNERSNFAIKEQCMWPIITDKYALAGKIRNYFWQDLWAARLIIQRGVKEHFDIGSRLDGFVAHLLAAGINIQVIDIREVPIEEEHLHTIIDDATMLHQIGDESIESMSALCSLEHFGLGRYGDPVDPEACFKCFANIQRKLRKGGHLYISVPVGKERVEFNAHRVFYASTIVDCFHDLHLLEYSCAAQGTIEYNVDIHKYDDDQHNGEWRYGLFHFCKGA